MDLDNVKDQNQNKEVVLMDVLCKSKESMLIITIPNQNFKKHFSIEFYKIDLRGLQEGISLELFLTHSHRNQVGLSMELENISKKIVKACNGLLLSLKVMRSFLRRQKKLRCWKQALKIKNNKRVGWKWKKIVTIRFG